MTVLAEVVITKALIAASPRDEVAEWFRENGVPGAVASVEEVDDEFHGPGLRLRIETPE